MRPIRRIVFYIHGMFTVMGDRIMTTLKSAGRKAITKTFGGSAVKSYIKPSLKKSGQDFTKAVYKTKEGGYAIKRKSGRTSSKDPIAAGLNRYYSAGGKRDVTYVYAAKSRSMKTTDTMLAVRFGKEKGWINAAGRFVSQDKLRNTLYALDSTLVSAVKGVSLLEIYDSMTPAQKVEFAEKTADVDWDSFWDEMYPEEGVAPFDIQLSKYSELLYELGVSSGW